MKYNDLLDIKLVHYLLEHNRESYNRLKNVVNEKSDDVFSFHINRLLNKKIISKTPEKRIRGKKTFYSLTSFGKYQYGLKLIPTLEKNRIYQAIYQELFLYEFNKSLIFLFTEKDFKDFLKRSNIPYEFEWITRQTSVDSDWWGIIYPDRTSKYFKSTYQLFIKEFWSKEKDKDFILCELTFMASPIKYLDQFVWIERTEHWQINRVGNNLRYATSFLIDLPGIDYSELVDIVQNKHRRLIKQEIEQYEGTKEGIEEKMRHRNIKLDDIKLKFGQKNIEQITKERVEDALKLLTEIKVIKIIQIGINKRIVLNDEKLRRFIETVQDGVHFVEMNLLLSKWYFFDAPTRKEKMRMKTLFDKEEARSMFLRTQTVRVRERRLISRCKTIYEYIEQLKILSGFHIKSRITDDPFMTDREKELYRHMTILAPVDEGYTDSLDNDLEDYENGHIPNEIKRVEKEIREKKLKKIENPSRAFVISLDEKEKELKKFNNYKKDIKMFFNYRKSLWSASNLNFEWKVKVLKDEFKEIFDKYEYVLKPVFEVFFPSLSKLESEPYYTKEEEQEMIMATMKAAKELTKTGNGSNRVKPKIKYITLKDGTKQPMYVFD